MNKTNEHTPLFLQEISAFLKQRQISEVIDATFAEGGHGLSLAKAGITVLGIEADEEMFRVGQDKVKQSGLNTVSLVLDNYCNLEKIAQNQFPKKVGAIIMDLGLSMYQLKHSQRGFSDLRQASLDLRLSTKQKLTAADWLKSSPKPILEDLLTRYLESPHSLSLVKRILATRQTKPILSVSDLREVINSLGLAKKEAQSLLRQTLQALRMIVNDEFSNNQKALTAALSVLKENGLLIVLTYHSLEDRMVKQFAKKHSDKLRMIQKTKKNKDYQFAKSGKLRIYEKIVI